MFSKITFNDLDKNKDFAYTQKLDFFKNNKEVTFKPGLNIIYAPNGTGKSTILSMLAISTACKQGGRSVVTNDWNGRAFSGRESLEGFEVFHDGQGSMYSNPREAVGLFGGMAAFDDDFLSQGIRDIQLHESTGKTTLHRLNQALAVLMGKEAPQTEIEYRIPKDRVVGLCKEMLAAKIEKGQFSVLLDEPESGLAVHVQANIFNILHKAAEEFDMQVIVATHSMFALSCVDANFIELEPNYLNIARRQLDLLFMKANKF